ncbi:helix-turn-helix domain-containing protein [bacterium]|nr:helix-turn-helix domain-containing protein [bacterium]
MDIDAHATHHTPMQGIAMTTELLTPAQLAERLQVRRSTVIHWARTGRIPEVRITSKVRRFDFGEVVAALRDRQRGIQPA